MNVKASKETIKKMNKMFDGSLPVIKANVIIGFDTEKEEYIWGLTDVEVLNVNLNSGSVKVRYIKELIGGQLKIETATIDIKYFYESYLITKI